MFEANWHPGSVLYLLHVFSPVLRRDRGEDEGELRGLLQPPPGGSELLQGAAAEQQEVPEPHPGESAVAMDRDRSQTGLTVLHPRCYV